MDWIVIKDQLPAYEESILLYKTGDIGGYYKGIYIGSYNKFSANRCFFIIEDSTTDRNNIRPISEFSHWMPLPSIPK
jgi:hypothetical protein